jgi:hypothetical protein
MNSFGMPEALILAGTSMISSSLVTEGWVLLGLGILSGFIRYTTWFGLQQNKED